MQGPQGRDVMGKRVGRASRKTGAKPKQDKPMRPWKDAPFEVDPSSDGDIATPKRELDEDEIKEQEERRS